MQQKSPEERVGASRRRPIPEISRNDDLAYPDSSVDNDEPVFSGPRKRSRKNTAIKEFRLVEQRSEIAEEMANTSESATSTASDDEGDETPKKLQKVNEARSSGKKNGEQRLKRWRDKPPQAFLKVKDRALNQRMYAINRSRIGSELCPEEIVDMAGTTGNIYQVHIKQVPSCTCPHAKMGNQCKHIVYVLIRVLKVNGDLQYQLAFLPSELRQIFSSAPTIPREQASNPQNRKPIEDDCPICCMEFEPEHEEIVHCKASCGNNIHKECFDQWVVSRRSDGTDVTCPFCRAAWIDAEETKIRESVTRGPVNRDGYVNIASALGMSGRRDFNTYDPYWVRRQQQRGADVGNWESPFDF